jgi:hypothetical protein
MIIFSDLLRIGNVDGFSLNPLKVERVLMMTLQ